MDDTSKTKNDNTNHLKQLWDRYKSTHHYKSTCNESEPQKLTDKEVKGLIRMGDNMKEILENNKFDRSLSMSLFIHYYINPQITSNTD